MRSIRMRGLMTRLCRCMQMRIEMMPIVAVIIHDITSTLIAFSVASLADVHGGGAGGMIGAHGSEKCAE